MSSLLHVSITLLFLTSGAVAEPAVVAVAESTLGTATTFEQYTWMQGEELPPLAPLKTVFSAPEGMTRIDVEPESWAGWLRGLPVRTDRTKVLAYDGSTVTYAPAAAVIYLDVGDRNLQQCADTAIRLHAEYHWANGTADDAVGYHFTSGDYLGWKEFAQGERLVVRDGDVHRRQSGRRGSSYEDFRAYLQRIFVYAGTRSLRLDTHPVPSDSPIEAGDVFDQGGSPGHAVIVLDIAEDGRGHRFALLGQGYMPAQELHVLRSSDAIDDVWFPLPEAGETLDTPSWHPFERGDALRF